MTLTLGTPSEVARMADNSKVWHRKAVAGRQVPQVVYSKGIVFLLRHSTPVIQIAWYIWLQQLRKLSLLCQKMSMFAQ